MTGRSLDSIELNRIITREQAVRHFKQVLEVGGPYNQTQFEAEIEEVPDSITDLAIFFRSDSGDFATTTEPYTKFCNQYNIGNGTIPSYKFKIDSWNGLPCLKVRTAE